MPVPGLRRSEPIRVLIVEDEPRFRELLLDEIPDMGFPATAVGSAEEARRVMEADPHDILLLDLQLPLMGGMEFFQLVRRHWPASQVIILTGFGGLDAAKQAIRMDVVDFLTKPCHLNELETALDRACRRLAGENVLSDSASSPGSLSAPVPPGVTLAEHERRLILETLARHHGNRTAAAVELGISRRTLHYRLSEYKDQGYLPD